VLNVTEGPPPAIVPFALLLSRDILTVIMVPIGAVTGRGILTVPPVNKIQLVASATEPEAEIAPEVKLPAPVKVPPDPVPP
jgi:hypothetical protein